MQTISRPGPRAGARVAHRLADSQHSVTLPPTIEAPTVLARTRPADATNRTATALSTLAHEIRGPLSAMALSSELLVADVDALPADQVRVLAGRIHRGTIWLQKMIDNMVCDAAIQENRFSLLCGPTDLLDIFGQVKELLEPVIHARGQKLHLSVNTPLPIINADARRIGQVLLNLVLNASKFSEPGTPIVVTLESRDEAVTLAVADRGPGLSGDIDALFEPFYRSPEARGSRVEGSGLGLSIVKAIVAAHGGSVGAENRRGGGARFSVQLPIGNPGLEGGPR